MNLTIVITPDDEMLIAQVLEVPGVITQGRNIKQVMENIQDALELYFLDLTNSE
ncbi:hypothetical protein SAMN05216327_106286 [Dyadobacter sp. SG02]|nr:hypothetical protein SAMN05216327_106286 [Dyadobacter sp. SG02]